MSGDLVKTVRLLLAVSLIATASLYWWTRTYPASRDLHAADRETERDSLNRQQTPRLTAGQSPAHTRVQQLQFIRQIWWYAPIFSGGGYSSEAIDFILGLHVHAGPALQSARLYAVQHGDSYDDSVLQGMRQNDTMALVKMMTQQPSWMRNAISICHSEPGAWALPDPLYETSICPPSQSSYKIGRTMFETDRLSAEHVRRCNAMDEVWVPTDFHKDVFANSGVDTQRLVVVPEPIDTNFFSPGRVPALPLPLGRPMFGSPQPRSADPFIFLSIFKWETRKAWQILLKAFLREFTSRDAVELHVLSHPFHGDDDFDKQAQAWALAQGLHPGSEGWPNIQVITEHIPQQQLPGLYAAAHTFVLPSRGEGWGRPHVEAMSMGVPVIATNWSGPTAFLDDSCGYLLRYEGLVQVTEVGAFEGHMWAEPSVEHLQQLMRRAASNPAEARAKGRAARQRMQAQYALPVVAEGLVRQLQRVDASLQQG